MHRFVSISIIMVSTAWAETIYKSVDEQGNIIYSEEHPAGSEATETLKMPPEPSTEEIDAARKRQEKLQEYLGAHAPQAARRRAANRVTMNR